MALLAARRTFSTALSTFVQIRSSSSTPDGGVGFEHSGRKKTLISEGVFKLEVQIWTRDSSWSSAINVVTSEDVFKNPTYNFRQPSPS